MWSYSHHMKRMGWGSRPEATKCSSISQRSALSSPLLHITHWWWTWPWSTSSTIPKDSVVNAVENHVSVGEDRLRMPVAVIKLPMTGCTQILWSQPVILHQRVSPVMLQLQYLLMHLFPPLLALQTRYVTCYSTRKLQTLTHSPGQGICATNI